MSSKLLYSVLLLIALALLHQPVESKKVVIHIPYQVKNVKHTHTIYKIISHHKGKRAREDDDEHEHYDDAYR